MPDPTKTGGLSYFTFPRGGPAAYRTVLCQAINRAIVSGGRRREFPQVRYEPGNDNPFLIGVAIDWEACAGLGSPPQVEIERLLRQTPVQDPGAASHTIDDGPNLRAVLSTLVGCEGYTAALTFEPEANAQRLAALTARVAVTDEADGAEAAAEVGPGYERLLYWCAAVGGGSLPGLATTAAAVGVLPAAGRGLWPLLRRLELLGHVKAFQADGRWRWCVAPTVYLQPLADDGPPFAAGQRLASAWDEEGLIDTPQPDGGGPARLASPGWAADESVRLLAEMLPPFEDYRDGLPSLSGDLGKVFHGYDIRRLDDEGYAGPPVATPGKVAVHQFTREGDEDGRRPAVYVLHDPDPDFDVWVRADPLTLTFAHRVARGLAVAVIDPDRLTLTIPLADRWPLPYEKALVLASGLLPRVVRRGGPGGPLLQYAGVPGDFARELCDKLAVQHQVAVAQPAPNPEFDYA
jgi:hypothetical protein